MASFTLDQIDTFQESAGLSPQELVGTNWQTTAAVGLTVASGGVLGALSLAAFPAQTLATGSSIAVLGYVGNRKANGKSAFPFMDTESDKTVVKTEAKTEV